MRLNHVANRAGSIVKRSAVFHANVFGSGDLNVIDVLVVPDRLKDRVCKTKSKNPLHDLFAEVVIDSINRVFFKGAAKRAVQTCGTRGIVTEWFFNDDPLPTRLLAVEAAPALAFGHKSRAIDALNNRRVQTRRDRQEKQNIAAAVVRRVEFLNARGEPCVGRIGCRIACVVVQALAEFAP